MVYYLGANLEWFGRQLNSYIIEDDAETTDVNESLNVSYTYDADGLRTSKTVDGATTTYQYVGDRLYYLCAKDGTGADDYEMYFFYDSYDKLTVLKYFLHTLEDEEKVVKEFTYYVATNYFGDVVGLYDGEGNILNSYEYDAWGNVIGVYSHSHSTDDEGKPVISTVENTDLNSIAHRNPIRYRSYYYDLETGLYYLQSRYYNPEIGRFLNADGYVTTGQGLLSYNMFAYCLNNPVMFSDPSGNLPFFVCLILGIIAVCTVAGGIAGACSNERLADKPKEKKKNAKKTPKPLIYPGVPNSKKPEESNSSVGVAENQIEVPEIQLTAKDRLENIMIGASLGLATGGAISMLISMPSIAIVGVTASAQAFSFGVLAFDFVAIVVAPFLCVDLEPVEWEAVDIDKNNYMPEYGIYE